MTKKEEDEAYLEGKARGFEEGYAKASDHAFHVGLFIVCSAFMVYILYRLTGCS
jgi:hypothetical protein